MLEDVVDRMRCSKCDQKRCTARLCRCRRHEGPPRRASPVRVCAHNRWTSRWVGRDL